MAYNPTTPDYIPNQPRPDAPGNVSWTQTLLIQSYAEPRPIVIDKEIKGGLHRVKYRSQLYDNTYDGIFTARRVRGMMCFVEWEDNGLTPCNKYYSLVVFPGTKAEDWKEVGSGAPITISNPKTYARLEDRDAATMSQIPGTVTAEVNTAPTYDRLLGTGTNFAQVLVAGDRVYVEVNGYDVISVDSDTAIKTQDLAGYYVNAPVYELHARANDFCNVIDARTPAEIQADPNDEAIYSASFIWDGNTWLRIYPYATDQNSHVQNTDTGLIILGSFISGDTIWGAIHNDSYRKQYNDLESLANAAAGVVGTDGNGPNAYSSRKIAEELLKRPVIPANGDATLFLNQTGAWTTPPGGGPGGPGLQTGDILGGGGADKAYFGEV